MRRDPSLWNESEIYKSRSCRGLSRKDKDRFSLRMTVLRISSL